MFSKLTDSKVVDYVINKLDKQFLNPIGSYVEILFDITNPGEWITRC